MKKLLIMSMFLSAQLLQVPQIMAQEENLKESDLFYSITNMLPRSFFIEKALASIDEAGNDELTEATLRSYNLDDKTKNEVLKFAKENNHKDLVELIEKSFLEKPAEEKLKENDDDLFYSIVEPEEENSKENDDDLFYSIVEPEEENSKEKRSE